jgi:hypothetical protein
LSTLESGKFHRNFSAQSEPSAPARRARASAITRRTGATFLPRCLRRERPDRNTNQSRLKAFALTHRMRRGIVSSGVLLIGLGHKWVGQLHFSSAVSRGQGAWIKANGAILIVCDQPPSRSISARIRHCSPMARPPAWSIAAAFPSSGFPGQF